MRRWRSGLTEDALEKAPVEENRRHQPRSPSSHQCRAPCPNGLRCVERVSPIARSCRAPIGPSSAVEPPGRSYHCARCGAEVLLCSCCDRGQRYCSDRCAQAARTCSLRVAGQRYQASPRGRRAHAERQRRYLARKKKVTHQGSPPPAPTAVLPPHPTRSTESTLPQPRHCHLCGRPLTLQVRQGFLRRRIRRPSPLTNRRVTSHVPAP